MWQNWGDAPRTNKLIFIGKNLDRAALMAGFAACANTLDYILEDDKDKVVLRFKVGDKVSWCKGHIDWDTPQGRCEAGRPPRREIGSPSCRVRW